MADQHDMVLDDQAGSAFLADLNLAILALAKLSDGATAPATTYAGMLWHDTANGVVKQRNAANSAWITRWTVANAEGTLGANLIFATDNTYDIGASGANRARDLFIARNANVGATLTAGTAVDITGTGAGVRSAYLRGGGILAIYDGSATEVGRIAGSSGVMNVGLGGSTTDLNASTVTFSAITTTASAANAFLNSGANNSLLRSTSSLRYKKDIENIEPAIIDRVVDAIAGVWYRSKSEADRSEWSFYGVIAEELASIDPRLVTWTREVISEEDEEYSVEEPVYENVSVSTIEVRDGVAMRVLRSVPQPKMQVLPLLESDGSPVMRTQPKLAADGTPIVDLQAGKIVTEQVQATVAVPVTTTVIKTRKKITYGDRMVPDGAGYERLGLIALLAVQKMKLGALVPSTHAGT